MKPPLILAVCVLVISIASVAGNMSALVLDGFIFDRAMVLIQMNDCCLFCLSLLLLLFLTKSNNIPHNKKGPKRPFLDVKYFFKIHT